MRLVLIGPISAFNSTSHAAGGPVLGVIIVNFRFALVTIDLPGPDATSFCSTVPMSEAEPKETPFSAFPEEAISAASPAGMEAQE